MSAATAGLPAYSGPDGYCPRCAVPGAMTEWHWAASLAPPEMVGRRPPCAEVGGLAVLDGRGEHLCRPCLNCGYGWPEACAGPDVADREAAPSLATDQRRVARLAACAGLYVFAGAVASIGAGNFLGLFLAGPVLAVAWIAAAGLIAAAAVALCLAFAGRPHRGPGAHLAPPGLKET